MRTNMAWYSCMLASDRWIYFGAAWLTVIGCGRVGYDQIVGLHGPGSGASTESGGSPASDAGSSGEASVNGGATGSGGAAGGGGIANGGTASAGSSTGSGGSAVLDAAAGGGAPGSGGTPGTGGAVAIDAAADGTAGSDGATGTGGFVTGDAGIVGCADGQREGFLDVAAYPNIAACDGGFQVPGIVGLTGPACGRAGGDDGARPDGSGCNVEDLCSVGFHVCASATEVGAKSTTGCIGAVAVTPSVFYLTLQSGFGQQKCGPGTNDVFGCGNIGFRPSQGCGVLDRASGDLCAGLIAPWTCGSDLIGEALNVAKPGSAAGGVLCCKN
jgi:hypothetical protein